MDKFSALVSQNTFFGKVSFPGCKERIRGKPCRLMQGSRGPLERHLDNPGPEDYVFTDRHGKYTNVSIYNKFKHLCKRAKVKQCMAILFTSF